jgi:hypothetical protein
LQRRQLLQQEFSDYCSVQAAGAHASLNSVQTPDHTIRFQLQVEQKREQNEHCRHKLAFDALLREQVEDLESNAEQMQAAILRFTGKQKWERRG